MADTPLKMATDQPPDDVVKNGLKSFQLVDPQDVDFKIDPMEGALKDALGVGESSIPRTNGPTAHVVYFSGEDDGTGNGSHQYRTRVRDLVNTLGVGRDESLEGKGLALSYGRNSPWSVSAEILEHRSYHWSRGWSEWKPLKPKNRNIRFQPAENLPNGKVWRSVQGFSILQKDGGKFRVYSPIGLIGVASSLEQAQQLIDKRTPKL